MANNIKKIYIGAICNRDIEVLEQIKNFLFKNYNISIIDLIKPDNKVFDEKYFQKRLKKYTISFLILKLTSSQSNKLIYEAIEKYASQIPILNDADSVKCCESRRETFRLIEKKCKKLNIPRSYDSIIDAYKACKKGIKLIIKLDSHNIPELPKNDRILGIAANKTEFLKLTKSFPANELFFQEYLGKHEILYKVYVIGQWVVSITSHNRLNEYENLSPLDLIHIRVPLDNRLKKRILRLGKRFGMSIYGLDYINTHNGAYIVDVNDFPSFRSIPEAISLISDYIYNIINSNEITSKKLASVKS
ncbi:MAG: hypothetical protein EAX89_09265 [Candidatus Lokiarchaeota archaeon]|nr:hypothetical protein [Candidatus Lokiarchaeota archaeon]